MNRTIAFQLRPVVVSIALEKDRTGGLVSALAPGTETGETFADLLGVPCDVDLIADVDRVALHGHDEALLHWPSADRSAAINLAPLLRGRRVLFLGSRPWDAFRMGSVPRLFRPFDQRHLPGNAGEDCLAAYMPAPGSPVFSEPEARAKVRPWLHEILRSSE